MTQPDWDDERLDAAFHARFDRPAPPELARDIHVRIAGTAPARSSGLRLRPAWSAAIAAVVVVAVAGTALVGLGGLGQAGGSPVPTDAATAVPEATATPTEQALPGVIFESLPIISVPDAIAIRDAGVDDREIAIHGWFTPASFDCRDASVLVNPVPVHAGCSVDRTWLTEDPEALAHATPTGVDRYPPSGTAIDPVLVGLSDEWYPDLPSTGSGTDSVPVDVVLVGHFDDRRATMCPAGEVDACRDRFVVDSVAMVHGEARPPSFPRLTDRVVSTEHEIATIVGNEAPGSRILSATVVGGETGLAAQEPSLGTGQANLIDQHALWVVRVLESDRVVNYIVIDGSDAIYEMNPEGEAILVGGEPPQPGAGASSGPFPPEDAVVIKLSSEVGAGRPPVEVAVVDKSGRLTGVAEKGTIDPSSMTLDRRIEAYAEPEASPGRVHLVWVGGICDKQITVTVAADIKTITFDMGPAVACDAIGIERELVLDFSGLVEVPSIDLVDSTGGPTAVGTDQLSEIVDCGDLGPDTCEQRTTEILAAYPDKLVRLLKFQDGDCGSYTMTFLNGTTETVTGYCSESPEPS